MPDALTASQVEVLRRVRDGKLWSVDSPLDDELREAQLLEGFGLIDYVERGIFSLTPLGADYLADIEDSAARGQPGELA